MKVLFDVTSLLTKELNGEGVYTKNLYRLLRGLGADLNPVYKKPSGIKENFIEYHLKVAASKFYGLFSSKGSILHGPSGNLLSESEKFKKVISINDMLAFRDGIIDKSLAQRLQAHMKEQMQKDPAAILVPTFEVHNEFLVRFPKYLDRVHVVNPGCDHILESSSASDEKITDSPYFLFVGTIDKKSNVSGIVKAFNAFSHIEKTTHLVIVGNFGFGSEALQSWIATAPCKDRIKLVGYKSGAQLKKIYADAIATLAPSLYEGFNYSIVESMKMGTPVLTSGLGAMAEIGRDASLLVNPKDAEQIAAGMSRLFTDTAYKKKLVDAGQEVTEKMTWLICAKKVAEIYKNL